MAQAQPLILTQTANGTFLLPAPPGGGGGPSILLTAQVHNTTMRQWSFFHTPDENKDLYLLLLIAGFPCDEQWRPLGAKPADWSDYAALHSDPV